MKRILSLILVLATLCALCNGCSQGIGAKETEKETEPTMEILQKNDPAQDDTINILMIGNSFCYYYVEELHGLAKAAGIKMRVCNVYYSGCTLEQHGTWWKNGEANYEFYTTDENGRNKIESTTLKYCLEQQNWDVISLQESSSAIRNKSNNDANAHLLLTKDYLADIFGYIKQQFPLTKYYWHQTWAYQVGYDRSNYKMETLQQQETDTNIHRDFTLAVCKEFQLDRVNSGEAWQIVRQGGYDNLCARLAVNGGLGDYYHDGDIGGGQYLNACVWFETITGQSCIGNTYRPDNYFLEETLITTLQEAAHKAVAEKE